MDEVTPPPPAPVGSTPPKGLIERITGILVRPKTEWGVIESEASTVSSIYTTYIIILAAIGPIAALIGQQLIGWGGYGVRFTPPIGYSVVFAVLDYGLKLAGVYVAALIIDALAPTFKGTKNFLSAFKVAAYSFTAIWLAQIFYIVPDLMFLSIVGLYSLYLLYLGLPRLMKVQEDQTIGYVGVVVFALIVINGLIMVIAYKVAAAMFTPTIVISPNSVTFG
jgi:hypothetical protein